MFMYRNNEESKSFEVFFFFFGGVGKRHPLFSSLFSVIRNPKTIKNPENCRREKKKWNHLIIKNMNDYLSLWHSTYVAKWSSEKMKIVN